jgi:hypothetical protein
VKGDDVINCRVSKNYSILLNFVLAKENVKMATKWAPAARRTGSTQQLIVVFWTPCIVDVMASSTSTRRYKCITGAMPLLSLLCLASGGTLGSGWKARRYGSRVSMVHSHLCSSLTNVYVTRRTKWGSPFIIKEAGMWAIKTMCTTAAAVPCTAATFSLASNLTFPLCNGAVC